MLHRWSLKVWKIWAKIFIGTFIYNWSWQFYGNLLVIHNEKVAGTHSKHCLIKFKHQFTSTRQMETIPLTLVPSHSIPVFYILLQAWSLLFTRSVTDVSWPMSSSGLLLIERLRPFLLQTEWLRLEDTNDMVVPCCPWQVLQRDRWGFMHSKYLKAGLDRSIASSSASVLTCWSVSGKPH